MGLCSCFGCFGADNRRSKEEERVASEEARAKAAEAAQKRFYLFPFLNFPLSLTRFHLYSTTLTVQFLEKEKRGLFVHHMVYVRPLIIVLFLIKYVSAFDFPFALYLAIHTFCC